jgi:hypothetical protein
MNFLKKLLFIGLAPPSLEAQNPLLSAQVAGHPAETEPSIDGQQYPEVKSGFVPATCRPPCTPPITKDCVSSSRQVKASYELNCRYGNKS